MIFVAVLVNDQGTAIPAVIPAHGHGIIKPWPKGFSGNPSGENAVSVLMREVREATDNGAKLIAVLVEAAFDDKRVLSARLRAIEILFERGWGKAIQPILLDAKHDNGMDDLMLAMADAIKSRRAQTLTQATGAIPVSQTPLTRVDTAAPPVTQA